MAAPEITVDMTSAIRAMEKVSPAAIERRSRAAMGESLAYLQTEIRKGTLVDTGIGRGSVFTEIRGTAVDLRGRAASAQAHMVVLEMGRRPGSKQPPLAPIRRWLERHGMDGGLAFVVARNIGRRGMKAHHMFKNAAERGGSVVHRIFARHFRL